VLLSLQVGRFNLDHIDNGFFLILFSYSPELKNKLNLLS